MNIRKERLGSDCDHDSTTSATHIADVYELRARVGAADVGRDEAAADEGCTQRDRQRGGCTRACECVGQLSASARAPRDTRDYSNERLTGGAGASLPRVVLVTAEPVVVALPDPTVVGREDDEGLSSRQAGGQAGRQERRQQGRNVS